MKAHGAVASVEFGADETARVLEDPNSATPRVAAMLIFIDKMTRDPDALTPADLAPLRAAGLSDAAIKDAIRVCSLFNMLNRIADALDFDVPPDKLFERMGKMLLKRGYAL